MSVYLLHFNKKYKHARHYLGFSEAANPAARIERHRKGHGARLVKVVKDAGIGFKVARVWRGKKHDRTFERRLKNNFHRAELCPICSGSKAHNRGNL